MIIVIGNNVTGKYIWQKLRRIKREVLFLDADAPGLAERIVAKETTAVIDVQENEQCSFDIAGKTLQSGKRYISGSVRFAEKYVEESSLSAADAENFFCAAALPGYERLAAPVTNEYPAECLSIPDGAANYILDQIMRDHIPLEKAAHEAVLSGYVSGNVQDSVNGMTAAYHLQWLCRSMFHVSPRISDIDITGFSTISQIDIDYARKLGKTLRLCAFAGDARWDSQFSTYVQPMLVPPEHVASTVHNNNCYLQIKYDRAYRTESICPGNTAVYLGEKAILCAVTAYGNGKTAEPNEYRPFTFCNPANTFQLFYLRIPTDVKPRFPESDIKHIEKINGQTIILTKPMKVFEFRIETEDIPVLFHAGLLATDWDNYRWPVMAE